MLRARISEIQDKVRRLVVWTSAVTGVLTVFVLGYQNVKYRQELAVTKEIRDLEKEFSALKSAFDEVKLSSKDTEVECKLQASAIANQRKDLNTVMRLISDGNKR